MSSAAVIVSRVVVDPVHQFAAPMLDSTDWHLLVWALVVGLLLLAAGIVLLIRSGLAGVIRSRVSRTTREERA